MDRRPIHAALTDEYVAESAMRPMYEQGDFVAYRDCFYKNRLQTSGISYTRKFTRERRDRRRGVQGIMKDSPDKYKARQRVLDAFMGYPDDLRVLSMPGIQWFFERALFRSRDAMGRTTEIYTVEREAPIFQASVFTMPGKTRGIRQLTPHAIQTDRIKCHYFTSVEAFISDPQCPTFDAAWLDLTGYVSFELLAQIQQFWVTRCTWRLALTCLNGRFRPRRLARTIENAGGLQSWLTAEIGQPIDVHAYGSEETHMLQMVFEHG